MALRTFASHQQARNRGCLPLKFPHAPFAVIALALTLVLGLAGVAAAAGSPAGGTITGKVVAEGAPSTVDGVRAIAYRFEDGAKGPERWTFDSTAVVDESGSYRFESLRAGTYRIRFVDSAHRFEPQVYDGFRGDDIDDVRCTSVFVTNGQTCSGINATLHTAEKTSSPGVSAASFSAPSLMSEMVVASGGTISGLVSGESTPTSPALTGIYVDLYRLYDYGDGDWDYDWWDYTTTYEGAYSFTGLPAGIYRLTFYDEYGDWAPEVYDGFAGQNVYEGGTNVALPTDGSALVNVSMNPASHITGRVVADGTQTGISNVLVQAGTYYDDEGYLDTEASVYTEADGTFDIGGLALGSYSVRFTDPQGRYITEYYDDVVDDGTTYLDMQQVSVGLGETKSGVNASLAAAGAISGTVVGSDGQFADPWGAGVEVYRVVNGGTEDEHWDYVGNADGLGTGGTYRVAGLPSGQYVVYAWAGDDVHLPVVYNNVVWDGYGNSGNYTLVNVTAGATTSGINAVLPVGGSIRGTVSAEASGAPIPNVRARTYRKVGTGEDSYWDAVSSTLTDSQGNYAITGLFGGSYRVRFSDDSGNYLDEVYNNVPTDDVDDSRAATLTVSVGQATSAVNASLASAGHIVGSVTTSSGAPIADAGVYAYRKVGEGEIVEWDMVSDSYTDSNGSYDLGGLGTGVYRVKFADTDGFLGECYNNVPTHDIADARCADVTATAGQIVTLDPASLTMSSHISGTVSVPGTGTPEGIEVQAFAYGSVDGGLEEWYRIADASADASGAYDLGDLSSGEYRIRFYDPSGTFTTQMYNSADNAETWRVEDSRAETLTVVDEQSLTGVDATMKLASHIKGRITSSQTGGRIGGARAQAYVWEATEGDQGFWNEVDLGLPMMSTSPDDHVGRSETDADGMYDIGGLPAGKYVVGFYDVSQCHDAEMYNDIAGLNPNDPNVQAFDIVAAGSEETSINAELRSLDEYEATDSTAAALPLDVSTSRFRTLFDEGDVDWVRLDLLGGVPYRVAAYGETTVDTVFELYDASGNLIDYNDDYFDRFSAIEYTPQADETVYLKVYGYHSYTVGPYNVSLDSHTAIAGIPAGWVNHDVVFTLDSTTARAGYNQPYYTVYGDPNPYSQPVTITAEGETTVWYWSQDATGDAEWWASKTAYVDKSGPTASTSLTGNNTSNARVTITATDYLSGVRYITYSMDGGAVTTTTVLAGSGQVTTPLVPSLKGAHTLTYSLIDIAGNVTTGTKSFNGASSAPSGGGGGGGGGDTTKPTVTVTGVPAGWARTDVAFVLSATDDSGKVASLTWDDGTGSKAYESTVTVSAEGTTTINYKATDGSGNEEAGSFVVRIDKTAPSAPSEVSYTSLTDQTVTLLWPAAADQGSGIAAYEVIDNGQAVKTVNAPATSVALTGLATGSAHVFSVVAIDGAGNRSANTDMTLAMPSTADSSPVQAGASQTVTLTIPSVDTSAAAMEATVTITGVTQGGALTIVRAEYPPTLAPATFRFLGEYFDVSFSGAFNGTVTVTLPYDPRIPDSRALNMKLKHYTKTGWEDVDTTVDLVAHTLTATLTSLSPVVAVEPEATITSATISIPKTVVESYRHGAKLTAKLKSMDASGSPLSGFTLLVQKKTGTDTWSTIATMAPSGTSGTYTAMLPALSFAASMRVVLSDNPLYVAAAAEFTVKPAASIAAPRASTTSARAYRAFTVTGTVKPAHASTVDVECYKVSGTKRTKVKTLKVKTNARGAFSASFKLARGTYAFKVVHSDTSHSKTTSAYSAKVSVR